MLIQDKLKKHQKILLGLLILIAIACFYFFIFKKPLSPDEIKERVAKGMLVEQDGVAYFSLNGYSFQVAKKYSVGLTTSAATHQYYNARISTFLPNFEPYVKGKNDYEFNEKLGFGKSIEITINPGSTTKEEYVDILKWGKLYDKYINRQGVKISGVEDLELYSVKMGQYTQDYIYNRNKDNYPDVSFFCYAYGEVPSPPCYMRWNLSIEKDLYIEATFSRDYLPLWKEIKTKTELMLQNKLKR